MRTGRSRVGRALRYRGAMTLLQALGLFVVIPLTVYVVIALAVYAPGWAKGPKYRPGLSWWAEPVWLGGGDLSQVSQASPVNEGGGCSARW